MSEKREAGFSPNPAPQDVQFHPETQPKDRPRPDEKSASASQPIGLSHYSTPAKSAKNGTDPPEYCRTVTTPGTRNSNPATHTRHKIGERFCRLHIQWTLSA